ncbi:MAG: hypothetical protein AAB445_00720 [Patescibacteria group bacterium]
MIKGRTPNIRTEQLRTFANKLVASSNNKFGNRSISKAKFNKLLEHAPVQFGRQLRSQKSVSTYQTKKFLGDFLKHIQEHPDYKVSTFARKALNVKLHQGDNVIQNFDPEHVGEKGLSFVAKTQQEADAAKNTGPIPKELEKQERLRLANIAMSNSQRLRAEEAGKKDAGFANPLAKIADTSGRSTEVGSSATTRKGAQTSAFGETKTAGQQTGSTSVPGQLKGTASTPSRSTVQLTSLGGLGRLTTAPGRSVPAVGAPDTRSSAPSPVPETSAPPPGGLAERYAEESTPTPTEVTDIRPAKASDESDDVDIDSHLPLAA